MRQETAGQKNVLLCEHYFYIWCQNYLGRPGANSIKHFFTCIKISHFILVGIKFLDGYKLSSLISRIENRKKQSFLCNEAYKRICKKNTILQICPAWTKAALTSSRAHSIFTCIAPTRRKQNEFRHLFSKKIFISDSSIFWVSFRLNWFFCVRKLQKGLRWKRKPVTFISF